MTSSAGPWNRDSPGCMQLGAMVPSETLWDALRSPQEAVSNWRIFLSGSMLDHSGWAWPAEDDATWDHYAQRVSNSLGGKSWSLVANSLQSLNWDILLHARKWLDNQGIQVAPVSHYYVDFFTVVGVYDSGPTRIHKDSADTFLQVLGGSKSMLLWPPKGLGLGDEEPREEEFVQLSLVPSDVNEASVELWSGGSETMFWPRRFWHCALSDGQPSWSVHLAVHKQWPLEVNTQERRLSRRTSGGFRSVPRCPVPELDRVYEFGLSDAAVIESAKSRPGVVLLAYLGRVVRLPTALVQKYGFEVHHDHFQETCDLRDPRLFDLIQAIGICESVTGD